MVGPVFSLELLRAARRGRHHRLRIGYVIWLAGELAILVALGWIRALLNKPDPHWRAELFQFALHVLVIQQATISAARSGGLEVQLQATISAARSGDIELQLPGGSTKSLTPADVVASHHRMNRYRGHRLLAEFLRGVAQTNNSVLAVEALS